MKRRSSLRIKASLGMMALAVWLILTGLTIFIPALRSINELMPLLALVAGVLILLDR